MTASILTWLCMLATVASAPVQTQRSASPASIPTDSQEKLVEGDLSFSFKPRVPEQPSWEITVHADRSGTYRELRPDATTQPIQVSEAGWQRLDEGTGAVSSGKCETKQKGIAQTGSKSFSLSQGGVLRSCTFNYSDDGKLNDAAAAFQALAETMQAGEQLQHDHRFDRLSLDADTEALTNALAAGRALEVANIAPVLQGLVDDDRVIDRARRRAARLLQAAVPEPDKAR